jgi:hypothetical protein
VWNRLQRAQHAAVVWSPVIPKMRVQTMCRIRRRARPSDDVDEASCQSSSAASSARPIIMAGETLSSSKESLSDQISVPRRAICQRKFSHNRSYIYAFDLVMRFGEREGGQGRGRAPCVFYKVRISCQKEVHLIWRCTC